MLVFVMLSGSDVDTGVGVVIGTDVCARVRVGTGSSSGEIALGVLVQPRLPTKGNSSVFMEGEVSITRARPKSSSFGVKLLSRAMFFGFMSLCCNVC